MIPNGRWCTVRITSLVNLANLATAPRAMAAAHRVSYRPCQVTPTVRPATIPVPP
jgi:hypothetical protein